MLNVPRNLLILGCLAGLAAAGCSAMQKSKTACTASGPAAVGEIPSTYYDYTPPQPSLSPIPVPPPEAPGEGAEVPPPPTTRQAPSKGFDFFEPANATGTSTLNN